MHNVLSSGSGACKKKNQEVSNDLKRWKTVKRITLTKLIHSDEWYYDWI